MSPLVRLADLKATCRSFHIRYLKEVIFFPLLYKPLYWNFTQHCPWSNFEHGHL